MSISPFQMGALASVGAAAITGGECPLTAVASIARSSGWTPGPRQSKRIMREAQALADTTPAWGRRPKAGASTPTDPRPTPVYQPATPAPEPAEPLPEPTEHPATAEPRVRGKRPKRGAHPLDGVNFTTPSYIVDDARGTPMVYSEGDLQRALLAWYEAGYHGSVLVTRAHGTSRESFVVSPHWYKPHVPKAHERMWGHLMAMPGMLYLARYFGCNV